MPKLYAQGPIWRNLKPAKYPNKGLGVFLQKGTTVPEKGIAKSLREPQRPKGGKGAPGTRVKPPTGGKI